MTQIIERGFNKSSGASTRWWTLDPIDGTQGFLRRGQYAVALALMESMLDSSINRIISRARVNL